MEKEFIPRSRKLITVDKRAYSQRLRGHKEKPEVEPAMTPEQVRSFHNALSEISRWADNADCMLFEPSPEQALEMHPRIEEIQAKIGRIRAKIAPLLTT